MASNSTNSSGGRRFQVFNQLGHLGRRARVPVPRPCRLPFWHVLLRTALYSVKKEEELVLNMRTLWGIIKDELKRDVAWRRRAATSCHDYPQQQKKPNDDDLPNETWWSSKRNDGQLDVKSSWKKEELLLYFHDTVYTNRQQEYKRHIDHNKTAARQEEC